MAKRQPVKCAICGVRRAVVVSKQFDPVCDLITYDVPECAECHVATSVAILCQCDICNEYVRKLKADEVDGWARGWHMNRDRKFEEVWPSSMQAMCLKVNYK